MKHIHLFVIFIFFQISSSRQNQLSPSTKTTRSYRVPYYMNPNSRVHVKQGPQQHTKAKDDHSPLSDLEEFKKFTKPPFKIPYAIKSDTNEEEPDAKKQWRELKRFNQKAAPKNSHQLKRMNFRPKSKKINLDVMRKRDEERANEDKRVREEERREALKQSKIKEAEKKARALELRLEGLKKESNKLTRTKPTSKRVTTPLVKFHSQDNSDSSSSEELNFKTKDSGEDQLELSYDLDPDRDLRIKL